jgi:hypothetical protein
MGKTNGNFHHCQDLKKKKYLLLLLGKGEGNDGQIKEMGKERVKEMKKEIILLPTLTNHVAAVAAGMVVVVVVVVVDHYSFYFLNHT